MRDKKPGRLYLGNRGQRPRIWNACLLLLFCVSTALSPFVHGTVMCYVAVLVTAFLPISHIAACVMFALPFMSATQYVDLGVPLHFMQLIELVLIVRCFIKWQNVKIIFGLIPMAVLSQLMPLIFCNLPFDNVVKVVIFTALTWSYYKLVKEGASDAKPLLVAFALGVFMSGLEGFGYVHPEYGGYDATLNWARYKGLWTDPNVFGMFCWVSFFILINLKPEKSKVMLLLSPVLLGLLYMGTLTLSRSFVVVGALMAVVYFSCSARQFSFRSIVMMLTLMIGVLYGIDYAIHLAEVRVNVGGDDFSNGRFYRTAQTILFTMDRIPTFLFGTGFSNIGYYTDTFKWHEVPHNTYVDVFSFFGIVGVVAVFFPLMAFRKATATVIRKMFSYRGHYMLAMMLYGLTLSMLKYELLFIFIAIHMASSLTEEEVYEIVEEKEEEQCI